jgi:osmotically-inducible protein OsmY
MGGLIMNKKLALISGIGLGAGLMFVFDPARGNVRRRIARDKIVHTANIVSNNVEKSSRNLFNHTRGLSHALATTVGALLSSEEVMDEVLIARVRSRMGRVISHPSFVKVVASNGCVTLSGSVSVADAEALINCVFSVRGVREIVDLLDIHAEKSDLARAAAV